MSDTNDRGVLLVDPFGNSHCIVDAKTLKEGKSQSCPTLTVTLVSGESFDLAHAGTRDLLAPARDFIVSELIEIIRDRGTFIDMRHLFEGSYDGNSLPHIYAKVP